MCLLRDSISELIGDAEKLTRTAFQINVVIAIHLKPITSKISLVSQVEQTLKLQAKYSAKALEMEETSVVYKKVIRTQTKRFKSV